VRNRRREVLALYAQLDCGIRSRAISQVKKPARTYGEGERTKCNTYKSTQDNIFLSRFNSKESTPHCGVPKDEGYTQTLASDPMINLSPQIFLIVFPHKDLHK
jgi:hypothetical protein